MNTIGNFRSNQGDIRKKITLVALVIIGLMVLFSPKVRSRRISCWATTRRG